MKSETEWPIQTWQRRYDQFSIEVVRQTQPRKMDVRHDHRGPYLWTLYAYIYPPHPHFAAFSGNEHWQPATDDMPLHGGCTFVEYYWKQGKTGLVVTAVQVGCDYNHPHDEVHTRDAEGFAPFRDAKRLAIWLLEQEVQQ